MTNVKSTKRKGIPHIENLNPDEFKKFKQSLFEPGLEISLKIDGAGFRFGKDSKGRKFCEGSRTGPIFDSKAFSTYVVNKGGSELQLKRAMHYDDMFDFVTRSDFIEDLPEGTKVVCEMLYSPMAEGTLETLKFVKIPYERKYLGTLMTVFPIRVENAADGSVHSLSNSIIQNLLNRSNKVTRILNPVLPNIDLSGCIDNSDGAIDVKSKILSACEEKSCVGNRIEGVVIKPKRTQSVKIVTDYYRNLK